MLILEIVSVIMKYGLVCGIMFSYLCSYDLHIMIEKSHTVSIYNKSGKEKLQR